MSTRLVTALTLVAAASLVVGCRPATDLNTPCRLVAGNPDGGAPRQLLEKEVRAKQSTNKDFISVGTVECEDFICVRDTSFQSDAGDDEPAFGYCSRPCPPGSSCPSQDSSLDDGPNQLRCRPLLLTPEVLVDLKNKGLNPGNLSDPYFCARGQPDGGA